MVSKEIIRQCIDNDRLAHASLYKSCAPYAYAIIKNYISDTHFRKDALQEVFAELFVSLSSFDETKGAFKSWLSRVTVHTCIDLQKKKLEISDSFEIESIKEKEEDVEININEKDLERVNILLSDMPEGYRTIFLLNQVEGYSHQKIGRLLEVTPETSRSQLNRAKKWIKRNMFKIQNLTPNEVI